MTNTASKPEMGQVRGFLSRLNYQFFFFCSFFIILSADLSAYTNVDILIASSYDGLEVHSRLVIPTNYDSLVPAPVLFTFHGANSPSGNSIVPLYRDAADARNWIIASPDMHGENDVTGKFAFGARAAQHDIIDLLDYLRDNYNIDENRLYLSGPSMGGGTTSIMAEKYPHVFAAGYEWMGYADMTSLYGELEAMNVEWLFDGLEAEMGGPPGAVPYEYDRRSPDKMAMNLRYFPVGIGHGTLDNIIPPHHAKDLDVAIESYSPLYYNGIHWFNGGHTMTSADAELICDFLDDWTKVPPPEDLFLFVDESKDYYYVDIVQEDDQAWSKFKTFVTVPDRIIIGMLNVSQMIFHVDETEIDPSLELSLSVYYWSNNTIVLDGLIDTVNYTLMHEGSEYDSYTVNNGVMTITIPGGGLFPMNFDIIPGV